LIGVFLSLMDCNNEFTNFSALFYRTHKRISCSALFKQHEQWLMTPKKDLHWCFLIHHDMSYLPEWHVWSNYFWFGTKMTFFFFLFLSFSLNTAPDLLNLYSNSSIWISTMLIWEKRKTTMERNPKISCFLKSLLCKIVEIFVKNNYKINLVFDKKYDRTPFAFLAS
jgi:hypothetical protein